MLSNNKKSHPLFVGIDGGGSKCKAVIMTAERQVLGSGISGPGNPLHGFEQATQSIRESAELALQNSGLDKVVLSELTAGVGLAGVNLPILYKQMLDWQHPFKHMYLTTDLLIACVGAHEHESGAVIITGTGSCGFSYVKGESVIIGGHGYPHGDKGSGAWFGLQMAKKVLLSLDGLIEPTMMNQVLLSQLHCKDSVSLVEAIAGKTATFYATLANIVFDAAESGDLVAQNIVKDGADYINQLADRLWQQQPKRMSIIGGLSGRIIPWLAEEVRQKFSTPLNPPEIGAVIYAQQCLNQ